MNITINTDGHQLYAIICPNGNLVFRIEQRTLDIIKPEEFKYRYLPTHQCIFFNFYEFKFVEFIDGYVKLKIINESTSTEFLHNLTHHKSK